MSGLTIRQVPAARGAAWIAGGWQLFASSWGQWVLFFLVLALLNVVVGALPRLTVGGFGLALGQLATSFLTPVFLGGLYLAARDQQEAGNKPKVGDLFQGFSGNPELLIWGGIGLILSLLGSLTAFIVAGPAPVLNLNDPAVLEQYLLYTQSSLPVALIFGLITGLAYWFGIPASALDKVPALSALAFSYRAGFYNVGALLLYGVLAALILLVGILALGLGLLVALPLGLLANYSAYRDVAGLTS